MWKHVRNITLIFVALGLIGVWYITRPDVAQLPLDAVTGPTPQITAGRAEIFPTIAVGRLVKHQSSHPVLLLNALLRGSTTRAIFIRFPMATYWSPKPTHPHAKWVALKGLL
jgi:hypothetical protein